MHISRPQGFTLGPILFCMFINDLKEKRECILTIFADGIIPGVKLKYGKAAIQRASGWRNG